MLLPMDEDWRPAPGWEGIYEISSLGRCRRLLPRGRGKGFGVGWILKPLPTRCGYVEYVLGYKERRERHSAHRLVAMAFIPGNPSLQVNHKNGIKTDNFVDNLEWVTCGDNHRHAYRTGLRSGNHGGLPGTRNGRAKITQDIAEEIRGWRGKESQTRTAERFSLRQSQVSYIQLRHAWNG